MKTHLYILKGIPKFMVEDYGDKFRDDIRLIKDNNEYYGKIRLNKIQAFKMRIQMKIYNFKNKYTNFQLIRSSKNRFRVA